MSNLTEVETSNIVSSGNTIVDEIVTTTEQVVQIAADSSEVVTSEPKVPTPFLDRFNDETIALHDDKNIKVSDVWVSNASLLNVSLAILARVDFLKTSSNIRDKELCEGFMSVSVTHVIDKKPTIFRVSIHDLATRVLELASSHSKRDYVQSTIGSNWRWTINQELKEEKGFDPFGLAKNELDVKLKDAKMLLLVKSFRMYLIETVRRVFPKQRNPAKWDSKDAVFRHGGSQTSCGEFVSFVESLFKLYDPIVKLTPELAEIKEIVERALTLGKKESSEKREVRQRAKNLEANYNQSIGNFSSTDIANGVASGGIKKREQKQSSTGHTTKTEPVKVNKQNVWKTEKKLTDKLVETGVVERTIVEQTTSVPDDEEETEDVVEVTETKKRTVKSGAPNKAKPDKKGYKKQDKANKVEKKLAESVQEKVPQEKPAQRKEKGEKKQKLETAEELEKKGWTTVKSNKKQEKIDEVKSDSK